MKTTRQAHCLKKLNVAVRVLFSEDEARVLKAMAAGQGLTLSKLIREMIVSCEKKEDNVSSTDGWDKLIEAIVSQRGEQEEEKVVTIPKLTYISPFDEEVAKIVKETKRLENRKKPGAA